MEAVVRAPLRTLLPIRGELLLVVVASTAFTVAGIAAAGSTSRALVAVVLFPVLVVLASIDLRHRLLPNAIVLPAAAVIALVVVASDPSAFTEHLAAGVALCLFLFAFAAVFSGGLGMGDAKLGLVIGLALGTTTVTAMFYALLMLFVAAVWILVRHGYAARKRTLPFGPFLAFGAAVAFFLG